MILHSTGNENVFVPHSVRDRIINYLAGRFVMFECNLPNNVPTFFDFMFVHTLARALNFYMILVSI